MAFGLGSCTNVEVPGATVAMGPASGGAGEVCAESSVVPRKTQEALPEV